jgi:signal transduction histidine kinase
MGIVSHELKTPVTSLKAYVQVLQAKFVKLRDEKTVIHLAKIDTQINKLTSLIGDLLDVTKIEGGKLKFHSEYFYFDELVSEIIEEVQRTTDQHELIKEGIVKKTIYADRERIGQVITNFLTNAIKYSPRSKRIIIKSFETKDAVQLSVQDFGLGIAKEKREHIFERFYRETGPEEITFPGLGLGLYISAQIIQRQQGEIWVESEKGKGSTFFFKIPLNVEKQQEALLPKEVIKYA